MANSARSLVRSICLASDGPCSSSANFFAGVDGLVRVLGHEINNSLAPIHSVSAGLRQSLGSVPAEDVAAGLAVIERRAESLMRLMSVYAKLARLPPPHLAPVEVAGWIRRVAALESRLPVRVVEGPPVAVKADADQLE